MKKDTRDNWTISVTYWVHGCSQTPSTGLRHAGKRCSECGLFPEACLVGARLVYFGRLSEPMPQNLGQLCRWPHLKYGIAERSCCGHAAAASSKLYSCLSPPPFPSAISPQNWTADHSKNLILKFTWTPSIPGTIV